MGRSILATSAKNVERHKRKRRKHMWRSITAALIGAAFALTLTNIPVGAKGKVKKIESAQWFADQKCRYNPQECQGGGVGAKKSPWQQSGFTAPSPSGGPIKPPGKN